MSEITFEIGMSTGTEVVTVPLDFSDATPAEIERVGILTEGAGDPEKVTCAFMFVYACRQLDMSNDDYQVFEESIAPMFDGDTSMLV